MTRGYQLMTTSAIGSAVLGTMLVAAGSANAAIGLGFNAAPGTQTVVNLAANTVASNSNNVALIQTNQCIAFSAGAANDWSVGSTFVVNLPTGVTFQQALTANASAGTLTLLAGGTAGSSTATYSINQAATAGDIVRIGCGTTAGSSAGNLFLTAAAYSAANTTIAAATVSTTGGSANVTAGTTVNLLTSGQPITATVATAVAQTIDTGATNLGRGFATNATNLAAARYATLATIAVANPATVNAVGGASYTLPTATETVTVSGPFTGISRAYLSTAACVTTAGAALAAGAIVGTISGNTATFTAIPTTPATFNTCIENSGSTVLQAGSYTVAAVSTLSTQSILGSTNTTVGTLAYNGTASTINYVTGGSAYQYFLRVTNPNSGTGQVFVVVTKDDGTSFSGSITTNLGANANALYSIATVNAATGANLGASDRARIQLLLSSGMTGTGILFNTATGVVTAAGGSLPPA
jgi:hypothetical protein